ncbi:type I secretion system permease/ATPase [Alsobacter sp. R-9]
MRSSSPTTIDGIGFAGLRTYFIVAAVLSAAVNILYLTSSFFMLEVYDRVIPSHSLPTLVGLCVVAALLYGFQGLIDVTRNRLLHRIGAIVDARLAPRALHAVMTMPLSGRALADGLQPVRDLDQVRGFLAGGGPSALFDLPWVPFYVAICFAFHPLIGVAALGGGAVLFGLALLAEFGSRGATLAAAKAGGQRMASLEQARRNAEAVHAMGMLEAMQDRWARQNDTCRNAQMRATDVGTTLGGLSKVIRMALQSGVLAIGAWLVIEGRATGGIIIAASIISSRALAPVELAIAHWKSFLAARQSWRRLSKILDGHAQTEPRTSLPAPRHSLAVSLLLAGPPHLDRPVLHDLDFSLKAGDGLGVIGPSGSGKSTLARLLVGVWAPKRGKVRLDGAALDQWNVSQLGRHVGYLPQDVELFAGTVAQNIARFDPAAKDEDVVSAAQAAGVHELILSMPDGYDTAIGEGGGALSAGQRQRIALARALYRDPFLVVLDEPNSNLDPEGETALTQAILGVRARRGIVVVIAHRPAALAGCNMMLALRNGHAVAFGPKSAIPDEPAKADTTSWPASMSARAGRAPAPVNQGVPA